MDPRARRALSWVAASALYYGAAWIGLRMAVYPETASPIWPATGVAIAALTILGPRAWPAIAAAVFAAELPAFGLADTVLLTIGNTGEAVAAASVLRALGGSRAFTTGSTVGLYLLGAAGATLISTLAALIPLSNLGGPTPLLSLGTTWYLGDLMGAALVTPPLVLLFQPVHAIRRPVREWLAFLVTTAALAMMAFAPLPDSWSDGRFRFLAIGPLIWSASRFGPRVTAWTALLLSLASLVGLAAAPLPEPERQNAFLLQVQALGGTMACVGLYIAATVSERNATIGKLAQGERMKVRFLNQAAHALRTPLTPLRIQLHLLQTDDQERRRQAAHVLERNVERLGHIVDRMILAARVEDEADHLEFAPVDAVGLIQEVLVKTPPGPPVVQDVAPGSPWMDAPAMRRALGELVSNALRFARTSVRVEGRRVGARGYRLVVEDDGQGMAAEEQERALEPFAQAESTSEGAGSGLGLFIAKTLVEGHGGQLRLEPRPQGGTRAVVELPGRAPPMDA